MKPTLRNRSLAVLSLFLTVSLPIYAENAKPDEKALFDGKSLKGWTVTDFAGHGSVLVEEGQIVLTPGVMLTGITRAETNDLPRLNYEVSLEAMKVDGDDFFCGLTFPVKDDSCTLVIGGWGGGVIGISSIDHLDASENETTQYRRFDRNRWYKVRVRVTEPKIEAWLDDEQIVDQKIVGRRISMRPGEIELSSPFGIAAWQTTAHLKNITLRRLE